MLLERNTANILLKLAVSGAMEAEVEIGDEPELLQEDLVDKLRHTVYAEVATSIKSNESSVASSPHSNDDSSSEANDNDRDKMIRSVSYDVAGCTLLTMFNRKQRNRMHAKLSRDRRKLFATKISELVSRLETQNENLRKRLRAETMPPNWRVPETIQTLY